MTIEFNDGVLACAGTLSVEDAETLLQLVAGRSGVPADLAACDHVHSACLQVLMAARVAVRAWPRSPALAAWLHAALAPAQAST